MDLLHGEVVLAKSDNATILLTTYRLLYEYRTRSFANIVSIMLEDLDASVLIYQSRPILLVIGILLCLAGLAVGQAGAERAASAREINGAVVLGLIALVAGIVCIVRYFTTRLSELAFRSTRSQIDMHFEKKHLDRAVEFLNAVAAAKNQRMLALGAR